MTKPRPKDSPDPISQAAEDGKRRKSFFSFGDEGVTATVSAKGRLLRISRHFPGERTGFCVDDPETLEPWFVISRLRDILHRAEGLGEGARGIGPSIDGICTETIVNDRWPTFDIELNDERKLKLQYVAYGGTIYQKFDFIDYNPTQDNDRLADDYSVPQILVNPDLLIRDLDFVNSSNSFNEADADDVSYKSHHRDNCLIREHMNDNKKGVLSIHVLDEHDSFHFVKPDLSRNSGESHKPDDPGESDESANVLGEVTHFMVQKRPMATWNTSDESSGNESLSLVLAYTLEYVAGDKTSFVSRPPWEQVSQTMTQLLQPYEKHSLTNHSNPSLDFFLGRNLEYILSVCSIPVSDTSKKEVPCFALTCGDVDGHRVAAAASFNSFKFLLVALDHFRHQHENLERCDCPEGLSGTTGGSYNRTVMNCLHRVWGASPSSATRGSYVCTMMNRIDRVCSGHVKWLLHKARRPGGQFSPNYWVNGEEITGWQESYSLPQKSLVNAPFQIIKACTYIDLVGKAKFPKSMDTLKGIIMEWVKDLDRVNKLGLYAFPRYDKEPTQSFYLTDHALIWQAIRSAEELGLAPDFKGSGGFTSYSSSNHLKRNILKRFTTENPQTKKRMIAVTRSPVQTRFLLRSRDTALFRAMELGLFNKPEETNEGWLHAVDLWKSTIDCQKYHEDNDDLNWDDPRRFALSLIMAQIDKSMNLKPPKEMFEHAMSVLLGGSSNNGLFPGRLNERHEPILYDSEERRDDYWEVVFDIPYILWKYCLEPIKSRGADEKPGTQSKPKTESEMMLSELQFLSRSFSEISSLLREAQGRLTGPRRAKAPLDYSMKYVQPFNNMVDEQNIVELQDEWLYNVPTFFVKHIPGTVGESEGSIRDKPKLPDSAGGTACTFVGLKIDVSKSKPLQKIKHESENKDPRQSFSTKESVRLLMGDERNMMDAKKRLWVFFSASPSENEACLNTIFVEEHKEQEMQSFFDRHTSYASFFTEETSAVLNTWTTEMHLSFYRLDTSAQALAQQIEEDDTGEIPSLPGVGKYGKSKSLSRVAMSFRVEGDLFDRYWTCRFLEADGHEMDQRRRNSPDPRLFFFENDATQAALGAGVRTELSLFLANGHENSLGRNSWQQRRVLELMLFGRILQRINLGANKVLAEAWYSLRDRSPTTDSDSRSNSTISEEPEYDMFLTTTDKFVISRKKVEQVQRVLRTLIGNLEENIAQIAQWQNREKDRRAERPRWTFHDENRFRVIIQRLLVSNDHDMLKLTRVHLKISKLEESLVKKLEIIRSDLEEQRGGETQLFTYVTVVFLPLGFATGIFSMSEAPATQTLVNMIYTALGAFFVIAMLGMVVKTVISANVVSLPAVTNWTRQDWSNWKAELKPKSSEDKQNVQDGDTVPDDVQAADSKGIWKLGGIRRLRRRLHGGGEENAERDTEAG